MLHTCFTNHIHVTNFANFRVARRLKIASPFMLMFHRKETNRLADDFDPADIAAATVTYNGANGVVKMVEEATLMQHLRDKEVKTAKEIDMLQRSDVFVSKTWASDHTLLGEAASTLNSSTWDAPPPPTSQVSVLHENFVQPHTFLCSSYLTGNGQARRLLASGGLHCFIIFSSACRF